MKMIRITATQDGFRRGGMAHPATAADHPADAFTEEQLEAIRSEPKLVVEEIEPDGDGTIAAGPAPEKMTVAELRELLDRLGVEYDPRATKKALVELVDANTAEPGERE